MVLYDTGHLTCEYIYVKPRKVAADGQTPSQIEAGICNLGDTSFGYFLISAADFGKLLIMYILRKKMSHIYSSRAEIIDNR